MEVDKMAASMKQLSEDALCGKKKIQAAGSLVPEQTIENVKEDIAWAKSGMKGDAPSR